MIKHAVGAAHAEAREEDPNADPMGKSLMTDRGRRLGEVQGCSFGEQNGRVLSLTTAADVIDGARLLGVGDGLARALVGGPDEAPPGQLNLAHHVFLDASARELYPRWAEVARQTVGFLRFCAGRRPADAPLAAVVAEPSRRSPEFREMWATQDVREKTHGTKAFAIRWSAVSTSPTRPSRCPVTRAVCWSSSRPPTPGPRPRCV